MQLYNNTPQQLFISIGDGTSADCGTLAPGKTSSWPYYDNRSNVSVGFSVDNPGNAAPFTITIPSTGVGKAVTIGFFVQ
jgi:hypothetical protein